jgi:hypothetical protein
MKEHKMGGACITCGRNEMHTKLWLGNLKGRSHSEHLGIDGRIILKWILGKWGWSM